ncbi:hypothetical protein EZV62_027526 [Acer yangbiense]|uniref:CCHC-type domain-containing protein n=1 Tax=Acer yangbiense TaxID=1000413 RepID=A0A5C7GV62_9ROSI|nr:hypothetical protein EZV62_027526 [Acer yangbiense]
MKIIDSKIAKLYENLSLADEDEAIHEATEEAKLDGEANVNHCLVGKVLSGKRVNRDAFKTLIDQLWSPFGAVETEVVGDNIFMFYFNNQVDRDWIWQRGPWYFEKRLIALEKPVGTGEISLLGFNRVELWVQIHDVIVMCMNRRMAKWMAEQIGEVIDIPYESKECWGRYMRVKVQIDILKPLKRWLRLKLDKTDKIVVVGLKYERLSEFCYACGKIGHGIKECLDAEARNEALTGKITKFGSWMRATIPDRSKIRNQSFTNGSSTDKDRSMEGSRGLEIENSLNTVAGSLMSQKKEVVAVSAAQKTTVEETSSKTLTINSGPGSKPKTVPSIEGPPGEKVFPTKEADKTIGLAQPMNEVEISVKAREGPSPQIPRKLLSPIRQALAIGKIGKKGNKGNTPLKPGPKLTGRICKEKSPGKKALTTTKHPKVEGFISISSSEDPIKACKRKVVFEAKDENRRPTNSVKDLVRNLNCCASDLQGWSNSRGDTSLARVIQEYFSTIFKSSSPSAQDIDKATNGINSSLNEEKKERLNQAFTHEEVKNVVFEMNPTKAPGSRGFLPKVLEYHW